MAFKYTIAFNIQHIRSFNPLFYLSTVKLKHPGKHTESNSMNITFKPLDDMSFTELQDMRKLITSRVITRCTVDVAMDIDCCICMRTIAAGDRCTTLTCKHSFCPSCVTEWAMAQIGLSEELERVRRNYRPITCPVCRTEFILTPPVCDYPMQKYVLVKHCNDTPTTFQIQGMYETYDEANNKMILLENTDNLSYAMRIYKIPDTYDIPLCTSTRFAVVVNADGNRLVFHGAFSSGNEAVKFMTDNKCAYFGDVKIVPFDTWSSFASGIRIDPRWLSSSACEFQSS